MIRMDACCDLVFVGLTKPKCFGRFGRAGCLSFAFGLLLVISLLAFGYFIV